MIDNNTRIRYILYMIPTVLFIGFIVAMFYVNFRLASDISYCFGETKGLRIGAQSARTVEYEYFLGETVYTGVSTFSKGVNPEGGKYVVAYSTSDPKVSLILYEKPLRYDHTEYDSIPYEVEKIPFLKRFRGYRDGFLP